MWFLAHKHVKLFILKFHWCTLLTNRTDHRSWVWLTLQQQEILGTWKLVNHCNKVLGEGLHGTIILGKDGNMKKEKNNHYKPKLSSALCQPTISQTVCKTTKARKQKAYHFISFSATWMVGTRNTDEYKMTGTSSYRPSQSSMY